MKATKKVTIEALDLLRKDAARLQQIADIVKNCPDVSFHFNDDATLEEVGGPPVGFTIRVGGHDEVQATATTFRKCVDSLHRKLMQPV